MPRTKPNFDSIDLIGTASFSSAFSGAVLKFDGTEWNPGEDLTVDPSATPNIAVQLVPVNFNSAISIKDGVHYFHVPSNIGGKDLVLVHAEVVTAGSGGGTLDIQIYNEDKAQDMLSTKLTIDSGETGSDTAATPAVIDTAKDDVLENEVLRVDVDAVTGVKPKGLIVTMEFA